METNITYIDLEKQGKNKRNPKLAEAKKIKIRK
jgi:hypothetical protein